MAGPGTQARARGAVSPGSHLADSFFSDTVNLVPFARGGLYVEVAGNVKVTCLDGNVETYAMAAKSYLNVAVKRIWATGTTATGVHALH